jgi:secondary thiamine-phosphate synthase enzyme
MTKEIVFHADTIQVALRAGPDMTDVTSELSRICADAGVRDGSAHVTAIGSTASVTTIEYEPGAVQDLKDAIRALAPPDRTYAHELTWHDGNGHSHVQAALLGPSIVVPIREKRLCLGTWQQVIVINHDIHDRRRSVEVSVIGKR